MKNGHRRPPDQWLSPVLSLLLVVGLCGSLPGCASSTNGLKSLEKGLESQAYDELAGIYSKYCANLAHLGMFVTHTRIEMAREIRQSRVGEYGPLPPPRHTGSFTRPDEDKDEAVPDMNTRLGRGPIVMIYCEGDEVPADVWKNIDRFWKD